MISFITLIVKNLSNIAGIFIKNKLFKMPTSVKLFSLFGVAFLGFKAEQIDLISQLFANTHINILEILFMVILAGTLWYTYRRLKIHLKRLENKNKNDDRK